MEAWLTAPDDASPWPERIPEPSFATLAPSLDVPDGIYSSTWPSGRLRLLAEVRRGLLAQWLRLEDGKPAGCWKAEGSPWSAQRYYEDGRLEDFARDDDTSEPYPAGESFAAWATRHRDRMLGPAAAMPDWFAENLRLYEEMAAGDRPPAGAEEILSGEPPADLEERLSGFTGLDWHHPHQCHERLLHYFHWEPELARDFTNFATAACAWAIRKPEHRPETFLAPGWGGRSQELPLGRIPMFARVRDAALAEGSAAGGFRHWARCLGECCQPQASLGIRLPAPIVWTVPPPGLGAFEVTRAVIELHLRQEASRRGALAKYLETVDAEGFLAAASRAGAFLQSPEEPPEDLAGFAETLEPPVLEGFGAWAHLEAGGRGRPAAALGLGRFVNGRGPAIRECVAALREGEPYWRGSSLRADPWPEGDLRGGGGFRFRAEEYLEESGLDLGPEQNRFLLRAEVAGRRLAHGPWKARGAEGESLQDLERVLKEAAGGEYGRWLQAAAWALSGRDARPLARVLMSAL